jgi:insertion element IS1 protein InsB
VGHTLNPADVAWDSERADEAEMEEMWSCVGHTGNPRWRWHAIDHPTGQVVASVFGRHQDTGFVQLQALLEPCGLPQYSTDYWGASTRHRDPEAPSPGQRNTQKIARKHLTFRTRMTRVVRKTICCSPWRQRHHIVMGFFVHRPLVQHAPGRLVHP